MEFSLRSRRGVLEAGLAGSVGLLSGGACGGRGRPGVQAETSPPALRPPLTYVALGASDAVGVGVDDPERDSWVAVLSRRLPQPVRTVNLGIPGIRLSEALAVEVPPALDARPDLVTVWLVVNDVLSGVPLEQYRADLDLLLARLRAGTTAYVAVGNIPNPPETLSYLGLPPDQRLALTEVWNEAIAAAARAHDAVLVDLFNRWPLPQNPHFVGPDGLHPTVAGYRSLAETFLTVLREARVV